MSVFTGGTTQRSGERSVGHHHKGKGWVLIETGKLKSPFGGGVIVLKDFISSFERECA